MSIGRTRYITLPPNSSPELRRLQRQLNERFRELDRRKPIATPTTIQDNQLRPAAEMNKGRQIFVAGTTKQTQYSDGATWQPFLSSAGSFAVPAVVLGTSGAAGSAETTIRSNSTIAAFDTTVPAALAASAATGSAAFAARRDHVHLFPTALRSTANASTLTLTDDGTDETLTGSLGQLNLRSGTGYLSLPKFTGGAANSPSGTAVLEFNANSGSLGTALLTGIGATLTFGGDGNTYTSQTHQGIITTVNDAATSGTTVTSGTLNAISATVNASAFTTTSTWTQRAGLVLAVGHPTQSGGGAVTVTDTFGIKINMQGGIGTAGTYTNAYGIKVDVPAWGSTIRRGISVATTTANRGTASANTEGVYVEDITIGTAQRANFYAEGATTGTPTDVYALFQGTAHAVGTNRYGARFTGATTGTPTLAIGVQVDAHSVGTTKWAFYGDGDASHFAGIDMKDATDVVVGTTTGTKIGTATTQKIGFWNKGPVIQPATTGTVLGFTGGGGTALTHSDTFTGNTGATAYTIGDIVNNLKTCGLLAA